MPQKELAKAIKQKMLTCVSEKYTSLGTEEITAQSLKDIFKTVPPLTAYDSDLTNQAVSEIQLKRNGTISLVLINGQRIGKEKSACCKQQAYSPKKPSALFQQR